MEKITNQNDSEVWSDACGVRNLKVSGDAAHAMSQ